MPLAFCLATIFGIVSPKMMTSSVSTTVDTHVHCIAREQDDDHGAERRRRDVDEVVADEDGAEGAVEVVEDADGRFRAAVAVLGGVFEPQAVGRRIRHFRRGEERRQRDQHDERGKIPHDAHAGSPPFSGAASAGAASSVSSGSRRTTSLTMRFCFMSEMRTSSR